MTVGLARNSTLSIAAAALAGLCWATGADAASYDAEYVFGDSLSDRGNLAEVYFKQNLPYPPSYQDSFTNGRVSAQVLAQSLGLTANPSLWVTGFKDPYGLFGGPSFVPGANYAVAGATAAEAAKPSINLLDQVAAFSGYTGGHADPSALYYIDIGGNDVRDAALNGTGQPAVIAGVEAELTAVQTLASEGARNFLIVNVGNVGLIPEFALDNPGDAATATALSQGYDFRLAAALAALGPTLPSGTALDTFDLYASGANILAHATELGFANTTDPCFTNTPLSATATAACGVNGANINSFIYWDAIHPTARVQAIWAQGMGDVLGVPVAAPEPSTWAMVVSGFAVLGFASLRRTRKWPASLA